MKFGSVLNNILLHNPVELNINIGLIMVMESKYIKISNKKEIIIAYLFFIWTV